MDLANSLLDKESFYTYYRLIYILAAFIALIIASHLDIFNNTKLLKISKRISILLVILLVSAIGLREYDVGTDTLNYYTYSWVMNFPPESNSEIFFYWILDFVKFIGGSFSLFLVFIAVVFYVFIYKCFSNISIVSNANLYLILFSFISLFFATSLTINVMRQGLALSFLLYAFSIWYNNKLNNKIIIITMLLLSFVTHTTSIIPILTIILLIIFGEKINIKWFYVLFFLGILLSAANFGLVNIAPFLKDILGDERRVSYLEGSSERYTIGFKPQFVVFNTVFLILFAFINSFKNNFLLTHKYDIALKYYIIMSFLFFMSFQIPYSDRWGLFSWVFIPILLAPIFSQNIKYKLNSLTVFFLIFIYTFFTFYASAQ